MHSCVTHVLAFLQSAALMPTGVLNISWFQIWKSGLSSKGPSNSGYSRVVLLDSLK